MERLGDYKIIEQLSVNATGELYVAEQVPLLTRYVVRVFSEQISACAEFRERFSNQGRKLVQLNHPHLVQIHYMSESGGRYYLVMDYVRSGNETRPRTLADELYAAGGRLEIKRINTLMKQICAGIEYAHEHATLHRKLKPENILLDTNQFALVANLGLAEIVGKEYLWQDMQSNPSQKVGSAHAQSDDQKLFTNKSFHSQVIVEDVEYTPPEVRLGKEWSVAGDIYSLGVLLYELLVGACPVGRFKLPSEIVSEAPRTWDPIVEKALAAEPNDRYTSVAEFASALSASSPVAVAITRPTPKLQPQPIEPSPPKEMLMRLPKNEVLQLVLIPAGRFLMGSPENEKGRDEDEQPVHEVTIARPFYMGKFPITQAQWLSLIDHNPSKFTGHHRPVESVSWDVCREFIEKLNQLNQGAFRLPSEAEWEYACRAGTQTAYCYGDNPDRLDEYAWYEKNSNNQTHPVGEKKPNKWGLYDMHGNVYECCEDDYHSNYVGISHDGSAWADTPRGNCRVVRGGCWFTYARDCRSANRCGYAPPSNRYFIEGIRLVLEPV